MNFDEGKIDSKKDGSAGRDKLKKRTKFWVVVGAAIVLVGLLIVHEAGPVQWYKRYKAEGGEKAVVSSTPQGTPVPLMTAPETTWPETTIPPGGESDPMVLDPDRPIRAKGSNFLSVYVYADGTKCVFGQNCPDGFVKIYFKNTSRTKPAKVMWAYRE